MTGAAKAVEIGRQTVYDYREADPQFLGGRRDAVESGDDELEAGARRRDIGGDQVPVIYGGKPVGHKPGKSDALMKYFRKNHHQRRQRVNRQLLVRRKRTRAAARQPHTSLEVEVTGNDGAIRAFGE